MNQPKPQIILFDLDDTLIHCNKYFDIILEQFSDLLRTWFAAYPLTDETIKMKQLEIDIAGVHIHGFSMDHFPASLVDTYRYFSDLYGHTTSLMEEEELIELGKSVYELQVEPYPGMEDTLERLKAAGHELYLYTGGIVTHQEKKIRSVKLDRFFGDRVFVRQHKTAEALEEILQQNGFDRSRTWMIGNSIRTDIVPALRAGINCIHIPAILEWEYNIVEINETPKGLFLELPTLESVPDAIARSIESAAS